jgi:hypothetical protein
MDTTRESNRSHLLLAAGAGGLLMDLLDPHDAADPVKPQITRGADDRRLDPASTAMLP